MATTRSLVTLAESSGCDSDAVRAASVASDTPSCTHDEQRSPRYAPQHVDFQVRTSFDIQVRTAACGQSSTPRGSQTPPPPPVQFSPVPFTPCLLPYLTLSRYDFYHKRLLPQTTINDHNCFPQATCTQSDYIPSEKHITIGQPDILFSLTDYTSKTIKFYPLCYTSLGLNRIKTWKCLSEMWF